MYSEVGLYHFSLYVCVCTHGLMFVNILIIYFTENAEDIYLLAGSYYQLKQYRRAVDLLQKVWRYVVTLLELFLFDER